VSEIWEFIARDDMQRADAFVDRLDEKFRALAAQPLMGRERRELGPGIRSIEMAPYVIFYEAAREGVDDLDKISSFCAGAPSRRST
jgi:toxin ParE1/3/4